MSFPDSPRAIVHCIEGHKSVELIVFLVLMVYVPNFKLVEKLHGLCNLEGNDDI